MQLFSKAARALPMGGKKLIRRWQRAREIARFLYVQRFVGFDEPAEPHFDPETREWFATRLRSVRHYLEFGCGGSTVLAARLGIPTTSVEGDPYYARAVRRAVGKDAPVTFLTPRLGLTVGWSRPLRSSRAKARRYVSAPFRRLAGPFPDFVLVDGRYRVACALEVARQAHLRGVAATMLVDDYGKRLPYRVLEAWLGPPQRIGRSALFEVGHAKIRKADVALYLGTIE